MIDLEKSFLMMYSNLCLNSRETVPLNTEKIKLTIPKVSFTSQQELRNESAQVTGDEFNVYVPTKLKN